MAYIRSGILGTKIKYVPKGILIGASQVLCDIVSLSHLVWYGCINFGQKFTPGEINSVHDLHLIIKKLAW